MWAFYDDEPETFARFASQWNTRISHSLPGDDIVEEGYRGGYDFFRNKWIGDQEEMITDMVRCFVPRPLPRDVEDHAAIADKIIAAVKADDDCRGRGKFEVMQILAALTPSALSEEIGEGNRDCLAKRLPGEPMFIILGRDPDGANIVRLWAERRIAAGDAEHGESVLKIADEMDAWEGKPKSAPDASAYPAIPSAVSGDAGEGESQITLSEYELRNIDELISVHAILGGDHYDTLWNLRNRIKPFVEGDEHFDPEFPLAGEGE